MAERRPSAEVLDARCGHPTCSADTYTLTARCSNCGWLGRATYTRGHETGVVRCGTCGCKTVRASLRALAVD